MKTIHFHSFDPLELFYQLCQLFIYLVKLKSNTCYYSKKDLTILHVFISIHMQGSKFLILKF